MSAEPDARAASGIEQVSLSRLVKERDLYAGLLGLNQQTDPEPFLKNALELITGIVGAERGCLELFDPQGGDKPWFHAVGIAPEELDGIRATISRGIISEAVATGQVVLTPSALLDPRFRDRASVK